MTEDVRKLKSPLRILVKVRETYSSTNPAPEHLL
jgi:hypothetical protein